MKVYRLLAIALGSRLAFTSPPFAAGKDLLAGPFKVEHQFELQQNGDEVASVDLDGHLTFDKKILFKCTAAGDVMAVCGAHYGQINLTLLVAQTPAPTTKEKP